MGFDCEIQAVYTHTNTRRLGNLMKMQLLMFGAANYKFACSEGKHLTARPEKATESKKILPLNSQSHGIRCCNIPCMDMCFQAIIEFIHSLSGFSSERVPLYHLTQKIIRRYSSTVASHYIPTLKNKLSYVNVQMLHNKCYYKYLKSMQWLRLNYQETVSKHAIIVSHSSKCVQRLLWTSCKTNIWNLDKMYDYLATFVQLRWTLFNPLWYDIPCAISSFQRIARSYGLKMRSVCA